MKQQHTQHILPVLSLKDCSTAALSNQVVVTVIVVHYNEVLMYHRKNNNTHSS